MNLKEKATGLISNVKEHWKTPAKGRYMPYKEIAAYSGGGIGAYMIITMGSACLLSANNTLLSSTLGVDPLDMYVMYVIAVLANIPLTGIRANIIDNTRNKAGKYRPYIVTMALPAAIICNILVWFPYTKLSDWLGDGMIFGETKAYVAKCAIIMVLNLILHFFYYFFYDAYENLIHVLSPNSHERSDVASIKSVVYSFAPTIVNLFTPIIAENLFHSNTTDIRVYRFLYPILTVGGLLLCMVVYKHTEEKIVQARTHIVQIKFIDAIKAVAKNKYFWIISLAGWIGFLESAYSNIMFWLYNYGGACSGNAYSLLVTLYGNASLWGMLLAPFCIRKWGKKSVLVVTNIFNIIFILMMLPFTNEIHNLTIWLIMGCLYLNAFMGSFAHILNPAIQADIRDYQQYKTGERIDGAFAVVTTIGTVIALITSSVLPAIYEKSGLTKSNAAKITSDPDILSRVLGDGKTTVGQILAEQLENGQDNYNNALSALYDPDILLSLIKVLIVVAAIGALMNVIPYIWYDFNEKKQESVIRVLKIRAMFEDYGNGILDDEKLVEGVDIIRNSQEMAVATPKETNKKSYKSLKDKVQKKEAKKAYRANVKFNDEIEIAQFVCDELNKFSTPAYKLAVAENTKVYSAGLNSLLSFDKDAIKAEIATARAMPKTTQEEKETRKLAVEIAKKKMSSYKTIKKYFAGTGDLVAPDFEVLEKCFNDEDECDDKLKALYLDLQKSKKEKDPAKSKEIREQIKSTQSLKRTAKKATKKETDRHAYFNRAAKVYLDAEKLIKQQENYSHLDEIFGMYDEAKARVEVQ
ncbi:MAG: MFS transporter [Clostridia bacterium]|nr:MFS transporter [Clostridia bacterium]